MARSSLVKMLLLAAMVLPTVSAALAGNTGRYEAVFVDGSRVVGDRVTGWGEQPRSPKLDRTALFDAGRPLRWLCDRSLKPWRPGRNDSYIEFAGGDRIVGRIEGVGSGGGNDGLSVPEHLLFKPVKLLKQSESEPAGCLRILPGSIQRVVFRAAGRRRLQPGSVYYLNGRMRRFVGLRWKDKSVVLLLSDGTHQVEISEIEEIHLPRIDPWKAYYRELAVLSPGCLSRMMRIETSDGLIATGSSLRFGASAYLSPRRKQDAVKRLEHLKRHVARVESQRKANQLKLDQARAKYKGQLLALAGKSPKQALELRRELAKSKQKLDEQTKRWASFLARLKSGKSYLASAIGPGGDSSTWLHILQPAWSLDPLRVPFNRIGMRWSFEPNQVPLSRIIPAATVNPPLLPDHTNRNADDRPLRSGGREYAWGFAVHAYSELRFRLPESARAFRCRIGLDRAVLSGGCARARIYVGSTSERAVYESPLLIGSQRTVETGRVSLAFRPEEPRRLILQADPVNRGAPANTDPFNIRDKLDWLDPRLELDKSALRKQVLRQLGPLLTDGTGWRFGPERGGDHIWTSCLYETDKPLRQRFWTMVRTKGAPLRIWRKMKIAQADKFLAVYASMNNSVNPAENAVALRIDERTVRPLRVPVRQIWRARPAPLLFPLDGHQGKTVTLELTQPPGGKPLHWGGVRTLETLPSAYTLADIMELVGKGDVKVTCKVAQALRSDRITKAQKFTALEISRLGGRVNFKPTGAAEGQPYALTDVLLGESWTGGDKVFIENFAAFKKMSGLKTLVVAKSSGVSDGAIAKLQAEMPKLAITRTIKRIPSHRKGGRADVTWRNLTDRDVMVLYVNPRDKLLFSQFLRPGQAVHVMSNGGSRLEAYYFRRDYKRPEQYAFTLPLATCNSKPGMVWDIKPVGN